MSIYRDGEHAMREADRLRMAKRRLVGVVRSANACDEAWETMPGDACTRRCNRCKKNVHDVAAMTESDLEDLVAVAGADGSNESVRFHRRRDGRFLVGDCPTSVALEKLRKRNQRLIGFFVGVILLFGLNAVAGGDPSASDDARRLPKVSSHSPLLFDTEGNPR